MSDDLLAYYNRELSFLRHLGAEFAAAHPKIAGRLRLGPHGAEDPHVERLLEAVAYLNARIRCKLDDDFPEISEAMLGVLYPHYLAPLPSMSVVQFQLDRSQVELTEGYTVAARSVLETEPIQGSFCRFHTCYPTTLWPIEVSRASLSGKPFQAPDVAGAAQAVGLIRLSLSCWSNAVRFADLKMESLRFFLEGQPQHVYPLYEMIFNGTIAVALAEGPYDPAPLLLGRDCLQPVGFGQDDGLLPYPARSFLGYRLLTEFFAFPNKFLFFDLVGLGPRILDKFGSNLDIFLYLNRTLPELEQNLSASTFRLGCAPVVNLYAQRAEPIRLTHADTEYRVVPDARRPLACEVYSIERVTATSPRGDSVEYFPLFYARHDESRQAPRTFWFASRRPAEQNASQNDHGTEVYLSLVDLDLQTSVPADWTVDVETICSNRDLPHRLPFGGGQPYLQMAEGGALLSGITCLTPPTRALRPALRRGTLWKLVSHLTLNHRSLEDAAEGADALRAILKLYDYTNTDETRAMIDGVLGVSSRRVVGRSAAIPGSFCRGVEVTVHLDEDRFTGSGLYLFACVLERFLGLYCTVNSFSQLVVTTPRRKGELCRWPPRMGNRVLL